MNRHQLHGVASLLEVLDSAASSGVRLSGHAGIQLEVNGETVPFEIRYSTDDRRYILEPS